MKIVDNRCYGGFSLSRTAQEMLGIDTPYPSNDSFNIEDGDYLAYRTHPRLIEVVERLGVKANGEFASLEVVEIPDDVKDWRIEEYDGQETIAEGRTW
jgi:hypothetical protein